MSPCITSLSLSLCLNVTLISTIFFPNFLRTHFSAFLSPLCVPIFLVKARGGRVEALKMPYFDFSICYKAEKKRTKCKKLEVNLTSPSRDIVPQRLGFTCNCEGSLIFKSSYLWTVFSTWTPLPEELAPSCGLKLGRCVP